ncbi:MAG TPA: UDP-N-acetylglucosamine 1-carboxyvinyltransferase [Verrucomicrobiae bacterium]|nr:UDP-N-acetylglucosamine 1-carboxyvinyltransferase [Verrucomicrobiae bacterium]
MNKGDRYVIAGRNRLEGQVRVSGAKNSTLPLIAASILNENPCVLEDVPQIEDVRIMTEVLAHLGCKVKWDGNTLSIQNGGLNVTEGSELMRKMRASNLVLGPLLGRFGQAKIHYPGGCNIGDRPMDQHLKGLRLMGAEISEKGGFLTARAKKLRGADIHLDVPSVGATENLMMAAVLADGTTLIRNAAREPEIIDLQNFLNSMGAKIRGAGLDVLRIDGVNVLHESTHTVIPDRIEAGTFLVAGAITGGNIEVTNVIPEHLEPVTAKLKEAGAEVAIGNDSIRVRVGKRLNAVDIRTLPYPGFPTDMQPQMMALLATANGTSIISESIFDKRFQHVDELRRMGVKVKVDSRVAVIQGVEILDGAFVEATDLRAGAALVLAGLAAEDATIVECITHIDRGYENLDLKLRSLGAKITRISNGNGAK